MGGNTHMKNLQPLQRLRLVWQLPLALAFIVAIVSVVAAVEFVRVRDNLEGNLLISATAMAHSVEQELSSVTKVTQALAATLEGDLLSRDFSAAQEKSARALSSSHVADHIVLSDESGQQLFNTLVEFGRQLPITNNIDRIKAVFRSGKPHISNLSIGTVSGRHEIIVDVPVIYGGMTIYVLTSVLDSSALRRILLEQPFPDEWVAKIFDGSGVVVSRTREHEKFVGRKVSERLLKQLASHVSGVYENINLDGTATVAAFIRSGDTGFGVTIGVPKKLLLIEVAGSLPASAISVAIAVFALLAAWHFAIDLKLRREGEAHLKQFIKHSPVALAMFDEKMNYIAASQRWCDNYHLGDAEFIGSCHHGASPKMPARWAEAHRNGLRGEITQADEDLVGDGLWLRWEVRPWRPAGGVAGGIVIFSEDITGRKLAEEEVRKLNAHLERRVAERTAELTAANHELDGFAYAVSHDLRAPLRAMSGFSRALVEDFGDTLEGHALVYLDQIGIAAGKMGDLIEGILALSRSTRGALRRDSIDISTLATQQLEEMAWGEPERTIGWSVEPALVVTGDAPMIEAALRNLLGNAWKYTAKAPSPLIRVYAGDVGGRPGICVADNGAGFDMAHADQLFQPFRRLHRQEEFPGLGIGLATVQRIMRRHGGEIRAVGRRGAGAPFCFTLPAGASEPQG